MHNQVLFSYTIAHASCFSCTLKNLVLGYGDHVRYRSRLLSRKVLLAFYE